jgi:protein-tyrosine phosphatase
MGIVARPRGGDWIEDEMRAIRREGVEILVSLLTPEEQTELQLEGEASASTAAGIKYINCPITDREVPQSFSALRPLVEHLRSALRRGKSVGAHCRMGIGRSSLLIAAVLCSEGFSADTAFALISTARGLQVPDTKDQILWVEAFARSLRTPG